MLSMGRSVSPRLVASDSVFVDNSNDLNLWGGNMNQLNWIGKAILITAVCLEQVYAQDADKKVVPAYKFLNKEWVSVDDDRLLTFLPLDATSGVAWLFQKGKDNELLAFTGSYRVTKKDGMSTIYLNFRRAWQSTHVPGFGVLWDRQSSYHHLLMDGLEAKYGVEAEVEAESTSLLLSVDDRYGITEEGKKNNLLLSVIGCQHFEAAEIVEFELGTLKWIEDNLGQQVYPPGFVARADFRNRQSAKKQSIYNTGTLKRDWFGWCGVDHPEPAYVMLSLLPGKEWDRGKARILIVREVEKGLRYYYGRGEYGISLSGKTDDLLVALHISKFYCAQDLRSPESWIVARQVGGEYDDFRLDASTVFLSLPLNDRLIPDEPVLFVRKLKYTDQDGHARGDPPIWFVGAKLNHTFSFKHGELFGGPKKMAANERRYLSAVLNAKPPEFKTCENLPIGDGAPIVSTRRTSSSPKSTNVSFLDREWISEKHGRLISFTPLTSSTGIVWMFKKEGRDSHGNTVSAFSGLYRANRNKDPATLTLLFTRAWFGMIREPEGTVWHLNPKYHVPHGRNDEAVNLKYGVEMEVADDETHLLLSVADHYPINEKGQRIKNTKVDRHAHFSSSSVNEFIPGSLDWIGN